MSKHAYIVCEVDENGVPFPRGKIYSITMNLEHTQKALASAPPSSKILGTHELHYPKIEDVFEVEQ